MRRTAARSRWCRVVPPAEPDPAGALFAQMRTDELRELLERYPDLDRVERRRLRKLYHDATATEVLAILSSRELASKAKRLDSPAASAWVSVLLAAATLIACAVAVDQVMHG